MRIDNGVKHSRSEPHSGRMPVFVPCSASGNEEGRAMSKKLRTLAVGVAATVTLAAALPAAASEADVTIVRAS